MFLFLFLNIFFVLLKKIDLNFLKSLKNKKLINNKTNNLIKLTLIIIKIKIFNSKQCDLNT